MSAHMKPQFLPPMLLAGEALVQGQAVKVSSGEIVACDDGASSVGDRAIGICQDDTAVGQPVSIAIAGGGSPAIAGGTITAGDSLKTDANGHFVVTTTADDIVTAIAHEDAVDGDVFAVLPTHPTKY